MSNYFLRDEQEKKAVEFLDMMGINKIFPDIVKAGVNNLARFFADLYEYPKLEGYIRAFEVLKEALVYYVTYESFPWGECFSLLYISKYSEDWELQTPCPVVGKKNQYRVQAWAWNLTEEWRSEFGSILVERGYGLLYRVG